MKASGLTPANLNSASNHYVAIGDGVHSVKPEFARDEFEFDPYHIESFAVINGQLAAAMYTMKKGKTMDDVPDIAGNWMQFHDHVLSYRSDNINEEDYFRLGPGFRRQTAPMLPRVAGEAPVRALRRDEPGRGILPPGHRSRLQVS